VNEGARILEEGIAARASDIDLVYLNGYGFPLHRGGPMLYADTVGLPQVVRSLRRFAAEPVPTPPGNPRRCSCDWPKKAGASTNSISKPSVSLLLRLAVLKHCLRLRA
jgi:short chain enoyl-CoA hydratase (EC 4.2.1.17)/3-hydroxyacyl-CoA dehydrogenase (EC 1.1.1.35)